MNQELNSFVKEALSKNLGRAETSAALAKAGWTPDEVKSAMSLYAEVDFPVPVPRRKPYLSAREAFIYLVLFTCLYISAFNFGSLLFDFINRWFPDALRTYEITDLSSIRFAVSALLVAFPIYLWLSSMTMKSIKADPEKRGSKIRKWLTYITLFITAGILIGDLISLLFNLLGGELTARFMLKTLVVLVIAGTVFGYYLWDLRQEEKEA
jgi:hypothetical protein